MPTPLIKADRVEVTIRKKPILQNVSFTMYEGEAWAIIGPAGSGKTTLANVIRRRQPISSGSLSGHLSPSDQVVMVEQQHNYRNQTDASATYYQARFDSVGSEDFPTVEEVLTMSVKKDGDKQPDEEEVDRVLELLQINDLKNTKLIQLSNGENKRFQLAKALLQNPKMLLLDNPFIGLDQGARQTLHGIINQLIREKITLVLVTTPNEIPEQITHVVELQENPQFRVEPRALFLQRQREQTPSDSAENKINQKLLKTISPESDESFNVAVKMQNVSVRYSGKTILDNVNWQVNRGDKWVLSGPNGAGKSTLLSLIYGDNPQAYANSIYLFDRRRGSGESIWDIKRRIGYISPELHLYFNRRLSCFDAVASGFTDTMTPHKSLSDEQKATIAPWLEVFRLSQQQEIPLANLPLSEQRLVLLARALVKSPSVLLLDEPCQGLDARQTRHFNSIIDTICQHFDKTLIYVSHYTQDVPSSVNRRLYLEKGKASIITE